jgi:Icc protein
MQVAFDLREDGPSCFVMEPPGDHVHHWHPDWGLTTHNCFVGEFDGPYPFHEAGRLID